MHPSQRESPNPNHGDQRGDLRSLTWLATLARPYARTLALATLCLLLSGGLWLVAPYLAGTIVDAALEERSTERMRSVILLLIGLFVLSAPLEYTETYLLRATSARLVRDLRARLHGHLLGLSPAFFERERVGDLLSRLNADVNAITNVLTSDIVQGLQQVTMLVGALVIMLVTNLRLTGVVLIAVPPVMIAAVLFGRRFERLSKERQELIAASNVAAEESLAGIRTVQAFVREREERQRYHMHLGRVLAISLRVARIWGGFSAVVAMCALIAVTLVLWYGGLLVVEQTITPGDFTRFVLYTVTVAGSVSGLTHLYGGLRSAAGATERVRELLATRSQITDEGARADGPAPGEVRGALRFSGLRFAYPSKPDQPAIDGLDLEVAPGEMVALVGPSGGGKSTLVSLLLRFYDPQEGSVELDGVDLRARRVADVRRAVGLVSQEIFLFGGTVAENLRFGRPDATDAELRAACEAASARAFVERLPERYETVVGERGVRLSVGERQRISIARVLLEDPAIVVLDEATSALDAESEHAVQQALARLFEGRTTLVVAHRLSTVRRADRVVLLDGGRITETGTHEELMQASGTYRRLCELQMLD